MTTATDASTAAQNALDTLDNFEASNTLSPADMQLWLTARRGLLLAVECLKSVGEEFPHG